MTIQKNESKRAVADYGPDHPMTGAFIVAAYTRAQAIADGELIDLSDIAQPLYWLWPVACTNAVYAELVSKGVDAKKEGESGLTYGVRARQLVTCSWKAAQDLRAAPPRAERFDHMHFDGVTDAASMPVWAKVGPGDDGEPCLTIMLLGED